MKALVGHIADAFAETAEIILPQRSQTTYFYVRDALQMAAEHIADAIELEFRHAGEGDFDRQAFLAGCCLHKKDRK